MAWVRIDDHLHSHPKIRWAWAKCPPSLGLHLVALSFSGDQLTDGVVDDHFVKQWLPSQRMRERATAALAGAVLWERDGDAWVIHDYLDYNESGAQIRERRRLDLARKRRVR